MDKKQRFVSLTLLGSQSPTSGGSLTWILVRAGIEASSGSSWGATATVREVGEMSHNSYVLWTFHSAPPSKSSLIKDLINTDILSGPDMHLWWSSMPKTFGNRWVKENNIQHCLISPSLRISKKVQSLIYQVPSDFVVDIDHKVLIHRLSQGDSACEILLGTFNFRNWIWFLLFLMFIFMIFQVEVILGNNLQYSLLSL